MKVSASIIDTQRPNAANSPMFISGTMVEVVNEMNAAMVVMQAMATGILTRETAPRIPLLPFFPSASSARTFSKTWMP
ncbi:MAG: hypothetical protein BWZ01_02851 [Deltaproteobacteria bacterium ADurb.BinA179]|nr:MAG: hypothetical protein BWZ01_02851 [Deltaproteobacteria bacterium ADurb.BinA179]